MFMEIGMRRTKAEAAMTRDNVLKAGLVVFGRKGFSAATLEDVAREAKVTRGAIYWHFGSKAELFTALEARYSARSVEIVRQAVAAGGNAETVLRRVLADLLAAVENDAELRSVMELSLFKTEHTYELAAAERQAREISRALQNEIAAVVQAGIASKELRRDLDPQAAARGCLALVYGILLLWLQDPQAFSLADSAEPLAKIFLQGVKEKRTTEPQRTQRKCI
jgi:TetR/AcrR family acrAB operon transcriptional repressor